jgi:Arc/MetJ-type ribon-helix-helix transcriptional regulator
VKSDEVGSKEEEKTAMMICLPDEGKSVSPKLKDEILMKLGSGLGERGNVVMTRLDNSDLKRIDALVEVEAFKSRSEAAAFFIRQGMDARKDLFERVMPTVDKIRELKEQAKRELGKKTKTEAGASI